MQNQKILENKINIKFKNKRLLSLSLVHKSFDLVSNNEKLEFLGDRVLALVLSKKLFNLYPHESEGSLDKKFASLVNRKTCLEISKILELEKFLVLGNTHKKIFKIENKILGDACEALIGAIYLDSGYKVVENFILKFWNNEIKKTTITVAIAYFFSSDIDKKILNFLTLNEVLILLITLMLINRYGLP